MHKITRRRGFLIYGLFLSILFSSPAHSKNSSAEEQVAALEKCLSIVKDAKRSKEEEDWREVPPIILRAPKPGELLVSLVNISLANDPIDIKFNLAHLLDYLKSWIASNPIRSSLLVEADTFIPNQLCFGSFSGESNEVRIRLESSNKRLR